MTDQDGLYDELLRHGASSETSRIVLRELKMTSKSGKFLQECIKAVRLYPQDPFLRKMLAESYADVGFISLAETELEKLTSQLDELIQAYKLQANLYQKQNRREEAIGRLRIYLAHHPEDHEALDAFDALQRARAVAQTPAAQTSESAPPETAQTAPQEEEKLSEESALPEIATPTLAEVYFGQGEIQEALTIYQRVLVQNPQDEKTRQRIEDLQGMLPAPAEKPDPTRKGKERAIAVLESWLRDLRKVYRDSAIT
ncbi:MAG: tetratricopeptide repeat protein [Deltaproteobacteria bacterium]|nr:tetratricopeptide repeat protein [Deltaproteobacteria bacterium]